MNTASSTSTMAEERDVTLPEISEKRSTKSSQNMKRPVSNAKGRAI